MSKITKKTTAKGSKKSTSTKITKNGRRLKTMKENFIINSREARLVSGQPKEANKAKPEVKAVEAVKAVKGVKAEASKIVNGKTQPAIKEVKEVKAVKAVKAQPATPAVPASYTMKIGADSKPIMAELIARMADQGIELKPDSKVVEVNGVFHALFVAKDQKIIRAAFKKSKSKAGYNAPGLALLTEKKKKEEAAAKKKAEAEKKKEEKKESKKDSKKEEGADWPSE